MVNKRSAGWSMELLFVNLRHALLKVIPWPRGIFVRCIPAVRNLFVIFDEVCIYIYAIQNLQLL